MAKCGDCILQYEKSKQRARVAKKRQKKKEELARPRQTILPPQRAQGNLSDLIATMMIQQMAREAKKPTLEAGSARPRAPEPRASESLEARPRAISEPNTLERRPRTVNEATMNAVNVVSPFLEYSSALFSAAPLIPGALVSPLTNAWGAVSPSLSSLATGTAGLARGLAPIATGAVTGAAAGATGSLRFIGDALVRAAEPEPDFFRPSAPPASVIDDLAARVYRNAQNAPVDRIFLTEEPEPLIPEGETPLPEQTILDLMNRPAASALVPEPLALYPEGESLISEDEFVDATGEEEPIEVEGLVEQNISPELPLEEEPLRVETAATLAEGGGAPDVPVVSEDLVRKRKPKESVADLRKQFGDFTLYEEDAIDAGFMKGTKVDVPGYLRNLLAQDRAATQQYSRLRTATEAAEAAAEPTADDEDEREPPTFSFVD